MNRILTIVALTLTTLCYGQNQPKDRIDQLLNSLNTRIERFGEAQKNVYTAHQYVMPMIESGQIGLNYDSTLNYGLGACAAAKMLENGMWLLSVGDFVLDIHPTYPLLAEAIVMHEIQHLYDAVSGKDFTHTIGNPIEETYYELDGLFIEALFIRYYSDSTDNRSTFDQYLEYDLSNNLESIALLFEHVDISLLHYFDEVRGYAKNEKEAEKIIFAQTDTILASLTRTGDDWIDFQHAVAAHTFISHSRQIVHDLKYAYDGIELTDPEVALAMYPKIDNAVKTLIAVMESENYYATDGLIQTYSRNLMSKLEAEFSDIKSDPTPESDRQ